MSRNVGQLRSAAVECGYDTSHWLRHLRKLIRRDATLPTDEDVTTLIESADLTMAQKVVLARAAEVGSPTHERIASLDEPAKTCMLDALIGRGSAGLFEEVN